MKVLKFTKYYPSKSLNSLVNYYYCISTEGLSHLSTFINHPQGNIDWLFILSGTLHYESGDVRCSAKEKPIVIGQQKEYFRVDIEPETFMIGVAFHSTSIYHLISLNTSTITNNCVNLNELLESSDSLNETFYEKANTFEKIRLLDSSLQRIFATNNHHTIVNWQRVEEFILEKRGLITANELASELSISERNLRRKFNKVFGLSPKSYLKMVRFNGLIHQLGSKDIDDWQDLLFQFQYYDQSHLIKDFKKYTNLTPKQFYKDKPLLMKYFGE